ncbi:hypothetical protein RHMOL_Rhmol07G0081800 [Rhododendron molle]|uniref:Uncharacterized protein n=1 Tax=Rhododendron molle TaxID=49168 RepID=A0ACC0MY78_RHOML|nr:hypothetical protein RHMOL_Rhmol07G0081800 [Rhododendron molle]
MEEENAVELLQRFRRDRRILLDYILSGSFIKKVVMPPGAVSLDDVDLDQVSVDYVLSCAKKGGMLELSEAIRDYHDNTLFPHMNNMGSTDEFFLVTTPDLSGSPPKRAPPPVPMFTPSPILPSLSKSVSLISTHEEESPESAHVEESLNSTPVQELSVDDIEDFEDDDDLEEVESRRTSRRTPNDASDLAPGLSSFATGISDDDLRETAYEILLAAAGASGGLIVPTKEKKKEKRSRFMRKLGRGKSEHAVNQSQHSTGLVGLLETMRVQMELNMLEEGLINHPAVGFGESGRKASELRILLAKIEESEFLPSSMGELQRTECLRSLREIVIPLAERPARGDLTGEVSHWADGYHLNVRLYEKLLLSVFDVLDEGKLTEEVEEILELLKSTWRILGITETIHYTCYAWVLFRQFVITSEQGMLQHAIEQLNKIPMKEQRGQQERLHLKSLLSRVEREEGVREFTFLQSFLSPIKKWADKQLGDYHLHFSEDSALMEGIVAVSMLSRRLLLEEPEMALQSVTDKDQIETYISLSLKIAFTRALHEVETVADATNEHPLALLAEQSKKLLQKEATMFMPILSQRHPQAIVVSASLLHRLYGNKLKPFINGAEHLTEDVVSVFPAADSLEQHVMTLIMSVYEETTAEAHFRKLTLYKIETVSGTLVLRWVNAQLGRILGWVERAIQQEHWDPVSPQQRHGSSIVEVYRIVEETVDQFFALKVPMRLGEMNSLFRGIDNAFQVYAKHVVDKIASKEDLIPPVPILTRHKKELGIKAFVKRELHDPRLPDVRTSSEITVLTTPTLCVQLNTLHYGISQLNKLEDSIWDRWTRKRTQEKLVKRSIDENSRSSMQKDTFDGSRKDFNAAIDRICEFTGTKIVFWDLREPFIDNLYKPSVPQSRMDGLIEPLDMALNQLCDIIVEALRDRVVTGLLQASLDGLLRVILDGGPSRVFSPGDAKLLEEDIEVLKTRELIEDIKSTSGVGMQSGRSKLGADTNTLLRILCHRSDSEASQFLKKQFKIPKSAA